MRGLATALAAALALAGCVPQAIPTGQPQWQLLPADEIAGDAYVVVTVVQSAPDRLAALGAALERDHGVELAAEWPLASISVHCFVFRVPEGQSRAAAVRSLERDARVRTAQPMQTFETLQATNGRDITGLQVALDSLNVMEVHRVATGRGVRVGVVDTLPDARHPELRRAVVESRDFVGQGEAPRPEEHGTAVTGVIAARASDRRGITGVAPEADILGLRGCWESAPGARGQCSSFSLARALNFALVQDVDVLNLSLGGAPDPLLAELISTALHSGVVVVAASGPSPSRGFPSSLEGVLAVSDGAGRASAVRAPGTDVLSTAPGGAYDFYTGSSIAAAHASGVAALLLDAAPTLTPDQVRTVLLATGRDGLDGCAAFAAIGADVCAPLVR